MRRSSAGLALAGLLAAAPVAAETLSGPVAMEYRSYQKKKAPKAFAANGGKAYAFVHDWQVPEGMEKQALDACEKNRKALREPAPCRIIDSRLAD